MRRILAVAIAVLALGACTAQGEIPTVAINHAFVDADNPDSQELGLTVDNCNGESDYEVEVVESDESLTITVFNHGEANDECTDTFTVHLDEPPHGKSVIDATTDEAVELSQQD